MSADSGSPDRSEGGSTALLEDSAGIAALAELVAVLDSSESPPSVAVSALTSGPLRTDNDDEPAPHRPAGPKPRVLLVEDNPVNRLLVGVLLDRLGLEHVSVGCGEEALFRFAREPFDAILLDVAMDGLAGLATARAIQRLVGSAMPPLVALGHAGLDEDVLEEAGFLSVADLPLDTRRLGRALIVAVERSLIEPGPD